MADGDIQKVLIDLERQGWDSLCNGTGGTFYGEAMTHDALMVLANGEVMDRTAVVASLGQAPPWRTYNISDVRVIDTGSGSAALVYLGTAYRDGDEPAFVALMSTVYVQKDGVWRLALYQQTPQSIGAS